MNIFENLEEHEQAVYSTELADILINYLLSKRNGEKMVEILIDRIEYGYTLEETGDMHNVSKERIRQMQAKAYALMIGKFKMMNGV